MKLLYYIIYWLQNISFQMFFFYNKIIVNHVNIANKEIEIIKKRIIVIFVSRIVLVMVSNSK